MQLNRDYEKRDKITDLIDKLNDIYNMLDDIQEIDQVNDKEGLMSEIGGAMGCIDNAIDILEEENPEG